MDPESSHPRSMEDDDLLQRNNKRVREEEDLSQKEINRNNKEHAPLSFRDKLIGQRCYSKEIEGEEWISDDDEEEQEAEGDPLCPKVRVSKDKKIRMSKPWLQTWIVKLLGRSIGY